MIDSPGAMDKQVTAIEHDVQEVPVIGPKHRREQQRAQLNRSERGKTATRRLHAMRSPESLEKSAERIPRERERLLKEGGRSAGISVR